jgi:hypothetical protein
MVADRAFSDRNVTKVEGRRGLDVSGRDGGKEAKRETGDVAGGDGVGMSSGVSEPEGSTADWATSGCEMRVGLHDRHSGGLGFERAGNREDDLRGARDALWGAERHLNRDGQTGGDVDAGGGRKGKRKGSIWEGIGDADGFRAEIAQLDGTCDAFAGLPAGKHKLIGGVDAECSR